MVGPLALAGVLVGLMVADDAARACSGAARGDRSKCPATPPTTAPFKQPLAGAGVELSARPVTATPKAAGSSIAFMKNSFRRVVAGSQQTPTTAGGSRTERIAQNRNEALKL
jgi:hypothetical protein